MGAQTQLAGMAAVGAVVVVLLFADGADQLPAPGHLGR
jgi:hypothetical protein